MEKDRNEKVVIAGVEVDTKEKDVVWPLFLIFAGVILLLNSLSIVDWNIWEYLFKFWPVFLILAGVKMIFATNKIGRIIVSVLTIIVLLSVIAFSYLFYIDRMDINDIFSGNGETHIQWIDNRGFDIN